MKILVCKNDGELIDTIENVEEYNLDKQMARGALVDEIQDALRGQTENQS